MTHVVNIIKVPDFFDEKMFVLSVFRVQVRFSKIVIETTHQTQIKELKLRWFKDMYLSRSYF